MRDHRPYAGERPSVRSTVEQRREIGHPQFARHRGNRHVRSDEIHGQPEDKCHTRIHVVHQDAAEQRPSSVPIVRKPSANSASEALNPTPIKRLVQCATKRKNGNVETIPANAISQYAGVAYAWDVVQGCLVANASVREGWFCCSGGIPSTVCPIDSGLSFTKSKARRPATTTAPATMNQPRRQLFPWARITLPSKGAASPANPEAETAIPFARPRYFRNQRATAVNAG